MDGKLLYIYIVDVGATRAQPTRRKLVHYNPPLRLMLGKCINKYQYDCQLQYFS